MFDVEVLRLRPTRAPDSKNPHKEVRRGLHSPCKMPRKVFGMFFRKPLDDYVGLRGGFRNAHSRFQSSHDRVNRRLARTPGNLSGVRDRYPPLLQRAERLKPRWHDSHQRLRLPVDQITLAPNIRITAKL